MWPEFYELVTTEPAKGRPILPPGHALLRADRGLGADTAEDAPSVRARARRRARGRRDRRRGDRQVGAGARRGCGRLRDDVAQTARNGPICRLRRQPAVADMEAYVADVRAALAARWPRRALRGVRPPRRRQPALIAGVGDRRREPATRSRRSSTARCGRSAARSPPSTASACRSATFWRCPARRRSSP